MPGEAMMARDEGHQEAAVQELRAWFERSWEACSRSHPKGSSAVLVPLLLRGGAYHVLYEIRSPKLGTQPGEICFPGGRIENGEDPEEAAVREAAEELCIAKEQIEVIGALEKASGPGGTALYAYIGFLTGYEGTFSEDEVGQVFTLPLSWILENDPEVYRIRLARRMPEDFPYEYVPGGRDYLWRDQSSVIPFYPGAVPVFWEKGSGTGAEIDKISVINTEAINTEASGEKGSETDGEAGMANVPGVATKISGETLFTGTFADSGENLPSERKWKSAEEGFPVLWGATARVTDQFAKFMRAGREKQ